jgi:hypothetical protein
MVLGTSLHEFNPEKVHLFVANLSYKKHDSINFNEKVIFQKNWAYHTPRTKIPNRLGSLRTPGQHRTAMVRQRKGRGHMDMPPPGMAW